MQSIRTALNTTRNVVSVGLGAFILFAALAAIFTRLVWWIDCHQGTERQRRLVRKSYQVYQNRLYFKFGVLAFFIFVAFVIFVGMTL